MSCGVPVPGTVWAACLQISGMICPQTQGINMSTSLTLFLNESVQPSGPCYPEV